jgi:hypothetical protein
MFVNEFYLNIFMWGSIYYKKYNDAIRIYLDTQFSSHDFFSLFGTQNNKIDKKICTYLLLHSLPTPARCMLSLGLRRAGIFGRETPAGRCVTSERRAPGGMRGLLGSGCSDPMLAPARNYFSRHSRCARGQTSWPFV